MSRSFSPFDSGFCWEKAEKGDMEKKGVVMNWEVKHNPSWDFENLVFFSGRGESHVDGESMRSQVSVVDVKPQNKGNCLVDLKLGRFADGFSDLKAPAAAVSAVVSPGSSRRSRSSSSNQVASCMVDDCSADLSGCKDYHKRHRVCEAHAKAVKVTVEGVEKRFCQQCSKFHVLSEFDEVKRSCRKRLDGHNKRRRKSQPDTSSGNSVSNIKGFQSYMNQQNFPNVIRESSWTAGFVKSDDENVYNRQSQMLPMGRQQQFLGESPSYFRGSRQYSFVQSGDLKFGTKQIETSICQPLVATTATPGSSSSIYSDSLIRVIDSDCALSLLSSSTQSSALGLNSIDIPMALPLVQGLQFNGVDRFSSNKALAVTCCSSDGVSSSGFSCTGIGDNHVGPVLASNAGHTEFHYQTSLQHANGVANSGNGMVQSLHFSWQ